MEKWSQLIRPQIGEIGETAQPVGAHAETWAQYNKAFYKWGHCEDYVQ